jgi:hypothetical protein
MGSNQYNQLYFLSCSSFLTSLSKIMLRLDAPPSSLLDPKGIQLCQNAEIVGTWCRSQLPALKGVKEAC